MDVATFLIFQAMAIGGLVLFDRMQVGMRISGRLRIARGESSRVGIDVLAVRQAAMASAVGRMLAALARFMPLGEKDREKISSALRRAGFETSQAIAVMLGAKFALVMLGIVSGVFFLPGVLLSFLPGLGPVGSVMAAIMGGVVFGGFLNVIPEFVVARLGAMRARQIETGFADAMDLLIVCLRSGMTFERGLQRTVADLSDHRRALASELRRASLDMAVHGRTRQEAMSRLAARVDNQVFKDLATTVSTSERHGTPLAEAMATFARSARVEAVAAAQAKIARLPVLLVLPTLAFVLPGIIVIVGGPAFVQLMESMANIGQ